MTVYSYIDISDVDNELKRLEDAPSFKTVAALEATLSTQYAASQQAVHIQTHSLKTSGSIESDLGRSVWRGEISYGGVSLGSFHNPVDYAEFEQARGGAHDFIEPVIESSWLYGIVVEAAVRGTYG